MSTLAESGSDAPTRRGARAWLEAPSVLGVLVGPERFLGALVRAFFAFACPALVLGGLVTLLLPEQPGFRRAFIAISVTVALGIAVVMRLIVDRMSDVIIAPSVCVVAGSIGFLGPFFGPWFAESSVLLIVGVTVASLWVTRRHAVMATVVGAAAYAISLGINGNDVPVVRWMEVVGSAVVVLVAATRVLDLVNGLAAEDAAAAAEVDRLVVAERTAAAVAEEARSQLAELNHTLEARVEEQVGQIERLGELRRFLSPQVADAVLAGGGGGASDALRPHRRRIAVVFCDLRGFTAYTNTAPPDDVLEVLDAFYRVVGAGLNRYGATVGPFQGDGVMAYFNDPVPCERPADTAVAMMLELRGPLDELLEQWAARGVHLGYGSGIAYGYATLGVVGFEGRSDYTPLGNVVNIAARLSDSAGWGEIVIDGRARHALDDPPEAEECLLELKGFERPVVAYRVPRSRLFG